jgi:hypothetical protein
MRKIEEENWACDSAVGQLCRLYSRDLCLPPELIGSLLPEKKGRDGYQVGSAKGPIFQMQ